ncbi:hypothetical protein [Persephonella sp.]|uniref:hypothetical protein n=1 Tax=Persephonella sp. TaxID=2060922 RepID=UPI0026148E04|nr:hypothetical protein [Persephonella sp.]
MKNLKRWLLIINFLFFAGAVAQPTINSDVRLEIFSQIKIYQAKLKNLKDMYKQTKDEDEKKLIKQHIKLIQEKIKKLEEKLKQYEKATSITG